jgi:hypothetical protein
MLQVEPRHLDLLLGAVARHVCLVQDLQLVCKIDYAQLAPDDLALAVYKLHPSHLRTRGMTVKSLENWMRARKVRRLGCRES